MTFFFILTINVSRGQVTNTYESETLKIQQIGTHVFVHISYLKTDNFGKVACNGMVYMRKDEAIVFDTPTNEGASIELLDWIINEQKKKVIAVIVTHFHVDCLGGLQQFYDKDIASYANNKTIELARQNGLKVLPERAFENRMEIKVGGKPVLAWFFGEGHTIDNIVGYVPSESVMFGGCLIKSLNANKGNLGDANVAEWSETVESIKKEIPDLKMVIPGHGESGGTELLDYTIQLFGEN